MGGEDLASVTITVDCVNDIPVAADDAGSTSENSAVTMNVAANDTDVDGNLDVSTIAVVTNPTNGVATSNGDGTITYAPNLNFAGSDSLTYRICDTDLACDVASVNISVSR